MVQENPLGAAAALLRGVTQSFKLTPEELAYVRLLASHLQIKNYKLKITNYKLQILVL